MLEYDQGLLTHTQLETVVPQQFFNEQNLKIGPKFNVRAPITLEAIGVASQNFST